MREYYFTGGEPFLNPEMEAILAATLRVGPASVLTNGLLLDPDRCARLKALEQASDYSLDLRVSLDGYDAASNDPIRGEGTFERILAGVRNLVAAGLNPVITVTEVCREAGTDSGQGALLRAPALPGDRRARASRSCRSSRSAPRPSAAAPTRAGSGCARGMCPRGRPGTTSSAAPAAWSPTRASGSARSWSTSPPAAWARPWPTPSEPFPLDHPACWTCHVYGVSCKT